MPAFLVPFVFVVDPLGTGLLLKPPALGILDVAAIGTQTAAGIVVLGVALQGRLFKPSTALETGLFLLAGTLLVFPSLIEAPLKLALGIGLAYAAPIGLALALAAAALQRARPG